mgnify:CR=1 FL=1
MSVLQGAFFNVLSEQEKICLTYFKICLTYFKIRLTYFFPRPGKPQPRAGHKFKP